MASASTGDFRRVVLTALSGERQLLLAVQASDGAELMAKKNGLTVADLLRPFASISNAAVPMRNSSRSYVISDLTMRVLPTTELLGAAPLEYGEPHLQAAVSASAQSSAPSSVTALLDNALTSAEDANKLAIREDSSNGGPYHPWYQAYRRELGRSAFRCLPFEQFDAPVALLVVASTADPNPIAVFHELASASSLPPTFAGSGNDGGNGFAPYFESDPQALPRVFILLHDTGAAAMGGLRAAKGGAASGGAAGPASSSSSSTSSSSFDSIPLADPSSIMRELRTCFPPNACHLLPINSLSSASQLAVTQPDVWLQGMQAYPPLFAATVERALGIAPVAPGGGSTSNSSLGVRYNGKLTVPGIEAAPGPVASVTAKLDAASIDDAPLPLPVEREDGSTALIPAAAAGAAASSPAPNIAPTLRDHLLHRCAVVPVRGCCLSGDDLLAIRNLMTKLVAELVLPSLEGRMFALHAAVAASKKGLRDTLRSWLGGGGGGGGGGGNPAASAAPAPSAFGSYSSSSGGAASARFPRSGFAYSPPASALLRALSSSGTTFVATGPSSSSLPSFAPASSGGGGDVAAAVPPFGPGTTEHQLRSLGDLSFALGDYDQAASCYKRLKEELQSMTTVVSSSSSSSSSGPVAIGSGSSVTSVPKYERYPAAYASACEMHALSVLLNSIIASVTVCNNPANIFLPLTSNPFSSSGGGGSGGSSASPAASMLLPSAYAIKEADASLESAVNNYFKAAQAASVTASSSSTSSSTPTASSGAAGLVSWQAQPYAARKLAVRLAVRAAMAAADVYLLSSLYPAGLYASLSLSGGSIVEKGGAAQSLSLATSRCRDAAALLRRAGMAEGEGSLLCALLTETAAGVYLRLQPIPSWRKAAHHLALSGTFYSTGSASQPRLALRCLASALTSYTGGGSPITNPGGDGGSASSSSSSSSLSDTGSSSPSSWGWPAISDSLLLSLAQRLSDVGDAGSAAAMLHAALSGSGWQKLFAVTPVASAGGGAGKAASSSSARSSALSIVAAHPATLPLALTGPPPGPSSSSSAGVPPAFGAAPPLLPNQPPPLTTVAGAAASHHSPYYPSPLSGSVSSSSSALSGALQPLICGFALALAGGGGGVSASSNAEPHLSLPASLHRPVFRELLRCYKSLASSSSSSSSSKPSELSDPSLPRAILSSLSIVSFPNAAAAAMALRCVDAWLQVEKPRARALSKALALSFGLPASAVEEDDRNSAKSLSSSHAGAASPLASTPLQTLALAGGLGSALLQVRLQQQQQQQQVALPLPVTTVPGEGLWAGGNAYPEGPAPTSPVLGAGWQLPASVASSISAQEAEPLTAIVSRLGAVQGSPLSAHGGVSLEAALQAACDKAASTSGSQNALATLAALVSGTATNNQQLLSAPTDAKTLVASLLANTASSDGGGPFPAYSRHPIGSYLPAHRQAAWSAIELSVSRLVTALEKATSNAAARIVAQATAAALAVAASPSGSAGEGGGGAAGSGGGGSSGSGHQKVEVVMAQAKAATDWASSPQNTGAAAAAIREWALRLLLVDGEGLTSNVAALGALGGGSSGGIGAADIPASVSGTVFNYKLDWRSALLRGFAQELEDEDEEGARKHGSLPASHTRHHHHHQQQQQQASNQQDGQSLPHQQDLTPSLVSAASSSSSAAKGSSSPYSALAGHLASAGSFNGLSIMPSHASSSASNTAVAGMRQAILLTAGGIDSEPLVDADGDVSDTAEACYSFSGAGAGAGAGTSNALATVSSLAGASSGSFPAPITLAPSPSALGFHFHSKDAVSKSLLRPSGEPVFLSLLLHNPLSIELPLLGLAPVVVTSFAEEDGQAPPRAALALEKTPLSLGLGSWKLVGADGNAVAGKDSEATAAVLPLDLVLAPGETRTVRLVVLPLALSYPKAAKAVGKGPATVPPGSTVTMRVAALQWRLGGLIPCRLAVDGNPLLVGPPLNDTRSQKSGGARAVDSRFKWDVLPSLARPSASTSAPLAAASGAVAAPTLAAVTIKLDRSDDAAASSASSSSSSSSSALATELLVGEVAMGTLTLSNVTAPSSAGSTGAGVIDTVLLCAEGKGKLFLIPGDAGADASPLSFVPLPSFGPEGNVFILPSSSPIAPGQSASWQVALRAGSCSAGEKTLRAAVFYGFTGLSSASLSTTLADVASTSASSSSSSSGAAAMPSTVAAARKASAAASASAVNAILRGFQNHPLLSSLACSWAGKASPASASSPSPSTVPAAAPALRVVRWVGKFRVRPSLAVTAHLTPSASTAGEMNLLVRVANILPPQPQWASAANSSSSGAAPTFPPPAPVALDSLLIVSDYWQAAVTDVETWRPPAMPGVAAAVAAAAAPSTEQPVASPSHPSSSSSTINSSGISFGGLHGGPLAFREVRSIRFRLAPKRSPSTVIVEAGNAAGTKMMPNPASSPSSSFTSAAAELMALPLTSGGGVHDDAASPASLSLTSSIAMLRHERGCLKTRSCVRIERARERMARQAAAAAEALPPSLREVAENRQQQDDEEGAESAASVAASNASAAAVGLVPVGSSSLSTSSSSDSSSNDVSSLPSETELPCSLAALKGGRSHLHIAVGWRALSPQMQSRGGQIHLIGLPTAGVNTTACAAGISPNYHSTSLPAPLSIPHNVFPLPPLGSNLQTAISSASAMGPQFQSRQAAGVMIRASPHLHSLQLGLPFFTEPSFAAATAASAPSSGSGASSVDPAVLLNAPQLLVSVHGPQSLPVASLGSGSGNGGDEDSSVDEIASIGVVIVNASMTTPCALTLQYDALLPPVPATAAATPAASSAAGSSTPQLAPPPSSTPAGKALSALAPAMWLGGPPPPSGPGDLSGVSVGVLPPGGRAFIINRLQVTSEEPTVVSLSQAIRVFAKPVINNGGSAAPTYLFTSRSNVFLRIVGKDEAAAGATGSTTMGAPFGRQPSAPTFGSSMATGGDEAKGRSDSTAAPSSSSSRSAISSLRMSAADEALNALSVPASAAAANKEEEEEDEEDRDASVVIGDVGGDGDGELLDVVPTARQGGE